MNAIRVERNGQLVCLAGIEGADMVAPDLSAFVGGDAPSHLSVAGMCDLPADRSAHVYWVEQQALSAGDRLAFSLVETEQTTAAIQITPTDDPAHLEEQRQFKEVERTYVPPTEPAERKWPSISFTCSINGQHSVRAALAFFEEHLLCTLLWNRWHPERLRVFVRSFRGASARAIPGQTEWLRVNLTVGDTLEVVVGV